MTTVGSGAISLGNSGSGTVGYELGYGSSSTISMNDYNVRYFLGNVNSGGYTYSNGSSSVDWLSSIAVDPNLQGKQLQVNGDAVITGELTVQGVSLTERLDKIEERLAILRPNEELEEKWENLRALGQAYRELEKEIIEKQKMWAILKK